MKDCWQLSLKSALGKCLWVGLLVLGSTVLAGLFLGSAIAQAQPLQTSKTSHVLAPGAIAPSEAADTLQKILMANWATYNRAVAERAQQHQGHSFDATKPLSLSIHSDWERREGLPTPCQLFLLGQALAAEDGQFSYGLISPWSINLEHLPREPFEQEAMNQVIATGEVVRRHRPLRGSPYFSALYPVRALSQSCVDCHNKQLQELARQPAQPLATNDLMGALWINLPLNADPPTVQPSDQPS